MSFVTPLFNDDNTQQGSTHYISGHDLHHQVWDLRNYVPSSFLTSSLPVSSSHRNHTLVEVELMHGNLTLRLRSTTMHELARDLFKQLHEPLDVSQIGELQAKGFSALANRAKTTRESLFGDVERELRRVEDGGCSLRWIDCLPRFEYEGLRPKSIEWIDGETYKGFQLMTK
ncbi:hypothetical protein PM082_018947 [Marasmius tenuissimus]|nr:hypothetical protein PM082_018947 [Marasmius tenuissimus]